MSYRALLLHSARTDFLTFARLIFQHVRTGVVYEDNWHLKAINHKLHKLIDADSGRQIVSMPPRFLKSYLISEAFPAFLLGRDPAAKIICTTYGEQLSRELAGGTLRIMQTPLYQKLFPRTKLASDALSKLTTTVGGMRFATSVGGPTTGFGGDWVIVDDPMNANDAHSEAARDSVKVYFDRALSSRVNNEKYAKFIVVMQRLHADDLAGHLLSKGGWDELRLQARATEAADIDIGAASPHHVSVGDLLHAARLPEDVLARKLTDMGSINFEAQYQQNPVPSEGNIIKRKWLQHDAATDADRARIVLSLDTATKANVSNDFSVCTIWGCQPNRHFLLDVWREKVEYPQLKSAILTLYQRYQPQTLLIEDHGNGAALAQELGSAGIPVLTRSPNRDKISRLVSSSSYIESGQMVLPTDAHWLAAFESELLGFPGDKHDDQVDSLSQYFAWVRERGTGYFRYSFLGAGNEGGSDGSPETLLDVLGALPRY